MDTISNYRMRQAFALLISLGLPVASLSAQNIFTRAAQRVASVTADMALASAVKIDAATIAPVPYGALQAGVASVDVVNGSVVRLHLYFYNGGDAPVTQPALPDSAFVLLDGTGRRFSLVSVRSREVRAGATTMVVPALERVGIDVVFMLNNSSATEAVLKIVPGVVIRGVPIHQGATQAPAAAPAETATQPVPAPPAEPTTQTVPATPTAPAVPAEPAVPATPEAPALPATPVTPAKSEKPAKPVKPKVPAGQAVPAVQPV